ncbi:zinc finger and BTB domain-containing protein 40-like [Myxocyprinus asiaticus]|uniref:zinc finger and BTB domain-containing protein 40-like n=1 Tax=Myxocyprinus asiaticus TaxID=70543 RepID=UPI0022214396|nr:zinc finger and BTB domain-containing protein 40-like [Myxocyprinus asiaticus]XP_051528619.1 zinc finger and BTB domain-containing protein 40-like [Myxocyprinus asiaticus]
MELPNYSRQLMQQLHALRKEEQFCDCSILVGETPHPAHKLVLAASSMLFKSALESSDSISIDTDLLSSQEFSCILDMVYTGKLPPGKHNFTRLIAAADSLQMFDVAVGCKNILTDLMKQTSETVDAETESVDSQVIKLDRAEGSPENLKESSGLEQLKRDEKNFQEDGAIEFISQNQAGIKKILQSVRPCIKVLETWDTVAAEERQVMLDSFKGDPSEDEVCQRLLSLVKDERVLSAQTVLTLLDQLKQQQNPDPGSVLEHQGHESCPKGPAAGFWLSGGLLDHISKLTSHLSSVNNLSELLTNAVNDCKNEVEKEVVLECCSAPSSMEVAERLICKLREKSISEETLLMLLHEVKGSSSDLTQLLDTLKDTRASIFKRTSQSVSNHHANSEVEQEGSTADSEDEEEETSKTRGRKKAVLVSYTCEWCKKTFDFKCRLIKHKKGCALSPGREQRCSECSMAFPTLKSLHQHCIEAHGSLPAKQRKTEQVSCDMCDKTFKHSSGLLYHKRTEHFEERPYACEECGAKFAATSSLKNHMRLHTGEKPFQCKHCDMSFSVAAALSYHTKRKHAEGKMYCCQYCSASFAQSIELTRHVRTHTGDKPYVCKECGKGFNQANRLSVHLQNFHNITEPHDCQKCRVSFSSLDELRQHIQEVHPKELHQCPECSKIFNSKANLEKHMNVHEGNKPYSCKACNKSYQTLSGLWYHNRTAHPEIVFAQGNKPIKSLLHCDKCDKTFSNQNSLLKHQITNHTEVRLWKCVNCGRTLTSEQELQQHTCSGQSSQGSSLFSCMVCSLHFPSEPEFQQHFLSKHLQVIQEEAQSQASSSQMVIQCEDAVGQEAEQVISLSQSQIEESPQVFVALGDQQETPAGSGIVAVSMEDLLNGTVTFICEEDQ